MKRLFARLSAASFPLGALAWHVRTAAVDDPIPNRGGTRQAP